MKSRFNQGGKVWFDDDSYVIDCCHVNNTLKT